MELSRENILDSLNLSSDEITSIATEVGVNAGLLTRGYLAGSPRLHPGEDA